MAGKVKPTPSGADGLRALGQRIRRVNRRELDQRRARAEVRQRLLAPAPPRSGRRLLVAAAAALVLATAGGLWLHHRAPRATFEVAGRPGALGQWVRTGPEKLAMTFSDASAVTLAPASAARVLAADHSRVRVVLERGSAQLHVNPKTHRRWRVEAGPFTVHVTGTRFTLRWQAERRELTLRMHRGHVIVEGPVVENRQLHAGDTLRVFVPEARLSLRRGGATPSTAMGKRPKRKGPPPWQATRAPRLGAKHRTIPPTLPPSAVSSRPPRRAGASPPPSSGSTGRRAITDADAPPTPASPRSAEVDEPSIGALARESSQKSPPAASTKLPPPRATPSARRRAPQDLRAVIFALAKQGRYQAASLAAANLGWDRLLRGATATQQLLLADVARLSDNPTRARSILAALRRASPRTAEAASAAFRLGRLGLSAARHERGLVARRARYAAAAAWFERCLRETRQRHLAQAAAGRHLEALLSAGSTREARGAAKRYLARFPKGPQAGTAQRVLTSK